MLRGVRMKRVFLVEDMAEHAPKWLRPLLRFKWILRAWRKHCLRKINKLTEGEVLAIYYEVTGHDR